MHYKLLGFSQKDSVRTYWFHRIGPLGTEPVPFSVRADTREVRKHNIPLQELPSLCSRLLACTRASQSASSLTVHEADLSRCAAELNSARADSVAAAQKRRGIRIAQTKKSADLAGAAAAGGRPVSADGAAESRTETMTEIRNRFRSAFQSYSLLHSARLRDLQASLPEAGGLVHIQAVDEHWRDLSEAERAYRSVRLQYIQRLLAIEDRK